MRTVCMAILALLLAKCMATPPRMATVTPTIAMQNTSAWQSISPTATKIAMQKIPTPQPAATICGGSVNLREQPTRQSRWLAVLHPGAVVTVLDGSGDWLAVEHGKLRGYIYSQYVCNN
jgi:SH3-like domain-containing protein